MKTKTPAIIAYTAIFPFSFTIGVVIGTVAQLFQVPGKAIEAYKTGLNIVKESYEQ